MFDKLIESDTTGAEFKGRSRYFMVSTIVVGVLFVTAVVISLYAADIDIGTSEFEMTRLLAPIAPDVPEPEPPLPIEPNNRSTGSASDLPVRRSNIARIEEHQSTPDSTSVVPNTEMTRPPGQFILDPKGVESNGFGIPGEARKLGRPDATGVTGSDPAPPTEVKTDPPPPVRKPETETIVRSSVINGFATYLPKPPYPRLAIAINAQGAVNVQVTIDESGRVIAASAVNGHPFLKPAAEQAARQAKFDPTFLNGRAVKVTGVIVYKFTRN